MRPRFDSIFSGPWPYEDHEGVGVLLEGHPTSVKGLINLMWQYSCHPFIGEEIVEELVRTGRRPVTLMPRLDFDQLAVDVATFGIKLSIIPPKQAKRSPDELFDHIRRLEKERGISYTR